MPAGIALLSGLNIGFSPRRGGITPSHAKFQVYRDRNVGI